MPFLTKRAIRSGQTDGPTLIIEKLAFNASRGSIVKDK